MEEPKNKTTETIDWMKKHQKTKKKMDALTAVPAAPPVKEAAQNLADVNLILDSIPKTLEKRAFVSGQEITAMPIGPDGAPIPPEMLAQMQAQQQAQVQAPGAALMQGGGGMPMGGGGAPMDPSMMGGAPMDPAMMGGAPMDPAMAQGGGMPPGMPPGMPMDPAMMQGGGQPMVDPQTGMIMDPQTGFLINPETGEVIDPATGQPIDPNTGQPMTGEGEGGEGDSSDKRLASLEKQVGDLTDIVAEMQDSTASGGSAAKSASDTEQAAPTAEAPLTGANSRKALANLRFGASASNPDSLARLMQTSSTPKA